MATTIEVAKSKGVNKKTITYASLDKIIITADLYMPHKSSAPLIILYHQAGWSRGEYLEIAPKLTALGFNCLAVDQRSGGAVNGVENLTLKKATLAKKRTTYFDAYQDMEASLLYAIKNILPKKIIIWGSSYSAALVFRLASEYQQKIHGVVSFSPGEYYKKQSKTYVADFAKKLKLPVFITSAKSEKNLSGPIYEVIPSKEKFYFLPKSKGNHGSRALWSKWSDHNEYWLALKKFLKKIN